MVADSTRKMLVPLVLLLGIMVGLTGGCGSDSSAPPLPLPKAYRINVPQGVTTDPALAVPAGVSEDGRLVVGTIYALLPGGLFWPVRGFTWTLQTGVTLIDAIPGYDNTLALGTNRNGSVIFGYAFHVIDQASASWVWTAGKGYQIIPLPAGTTDSTLNDVTADGTLLLGSFVMPDGEGNDVRDLFVWSQQKGFVPLRVGYAGVQMLPVGIADDGLTIAYNCLTLDKESDIKCSADGTWTLQSSSPAWIDTDGSRMFVEIAPPAVQSQNQFSASDMSSGEFGFYAAHSGDLLVLGGYSNILVFDEQVLGSHPALWLEGPGHLNILTGLGWLGRTSSVSPDGTYAGYDSHFGAGSSQAYLWTAADGVNDLYYLMWHADITLGTNLLDTFSSDPPSYLMGFSGDNERVAGATFNFSGADMYGFVIDNVSRLLPR